METPVAEVAEGRPGTKENVSESNTYPTRAGYYVFQGLVGVRKRAYNKGRLTPDAARGHIRSKNRMR